MADTTSAADDVSSRTRPAPARPDGDWKRTLIALAAVLAVSLIVRNTLLESFSVPTFAMSPGLLPGDVVLVNKQVPLQGRLPAYGSIVVYIDATEGERFLVRRVIGRPGDRIRLTHGRVLRNGKFVTDAWVKALAAEDGLGCARERVGVLPPKKKKPSESAAVPAERFFEVCQDEPQLPDQATLTVPKGKVFVLGDRRTVPAELSPQWLAGNRLILPAGAGLIDREQIIGSVTRILVSIVPPGGEPGMSWTERIRWDRFWKRIEIP